MEATKDLIHGFLVGASEDAAVYNKKRKNEYIVEIEQKSKEWLEFVQEAVLRFFGKNIKIRKTSKGFYRLTIYSKDFFTEIKKHRENSSWILNESDEFQTGFLQGFYDAEGSIKKSRNHITSSSNRKDLIDVAEELLKKFNIRTGKQWKDKNNVITLPFYGKDNMIKFSRIVDFRHPEKRERLARHLEKYHLQNPYNGVVAGKSSLPALFLEN